MDSYKLKNTGWSDHIWLERSLPLVGIVNSSFKFLIVKLFELGFESVNDTQKTKQTDSLLSVSLWKSLLLKNGSGPSPVSLKFENKQ